MPATTLEGWAGRYERGAAVILRDGVLRLQQREGEGSDPMVALSDSVFAPGAAEGREVTDSLDCHAGARDQSLLFVITLERAPRAKAAEAPS